VKESVDMLSNERPGKQFVNDWTDLIKRLTGSVMNVKVLVKRTTCQKRD
jgi:hypothetical protein